MFAFGFASAIPAFAAAPAAVGPRGPEIEIVLPPAPDRSRQAEFLKGMASSRLFPGARVREARRGEAARIFARFRFQDLPLIRPAKRLLEAAGLREVTLQVFPDGDLVRLVASVRVDRRVPPPLANAPLAVPAMREGDWATAALSLDTARLVPWAVDVAARADEFQGQILKDSLVVAKWNLGLDVEGEIAGSFAGGVRALAARGGGGGDSVALVVDVRSPDPLAKALAALALGSHLMSGACAGLEPARVGETQAYRIRTPWPGLAPAIVLRDGALLASTREGAIGADPDALRRRLSAEVGTRRERAAMSTQPATVAGAPDAAYRRVPTAPRALAKIGGGEICAAGVVNVLEGVRAARALARAAGLDQSGFPTPASLAWADGEAAVAVRAGGEGFQIWGAWVPSRSALAVPEDDTLASKGP